MIPFIWRIGIGTLLFVLLLPLAAQAFLRKELPSTHQPRLRKAAKFFDADKDGSLNWQERGRFETYRIYGWDLADTKRKRKFDVNNDFMLNPTELKKYRDFRR